MEYIDKQLTTFLKTTSEIIKEQCSYYFSVKSLWLFRHIPEINSFKTWGYYCVDHRLQFLYDKLNNTISNKVIPESVGTLGKVYNGGEWFYENNTYAALEGTVIEIDLTMEHQSVLFIPIKDDDNIIISILLVSISPTRDVLESISSCPNYISNRFIKDVETLLSAQLENNYINEKIRLAYGYQHNRDIIDNFKNSKLDYDIYSFSPEKYLRDFLIAPLIKSQTSKIPVIEIKGSPYNNGFIAFSESAYNIYENTIKVNYEANRKINLQKVDTISLTIADERKLLTLKYSFYSNSFDIAHDIISKIEKFIYNEKINEVVDDLLTSKRNYLIIDIETRLIVKKKYVSEKIAQKCIELLTTDTYKRVSFAVSLEYEWSFKENHHELIYYNAAAVDDKQLLDPFKQKYVVFYDKASQKITEKQIDKENLAIIVRSDEQNYPFNDLVIEFINQRLLYYTILSERQRAITESMKSAIAAIMSRNMSHNLGSHYLYYTKTQLASLAEEVGNKAPDIRGAAKVISYIQGRMDYLATIISNDKYPYGSVNFKSQIWDELTVDDFSKRHYSTSESILLSKTEYNKQLIAIFNLLKQADNLKRTYERIEPTTSSEDVIAIGAEIGKQIEKTTKKIGNNYSEIIRGGVNRRTTNFLLTNLILSENYTRPGIIDSKLGDGKFSLQLYASLWNEHTHTYELFTGTDNTDVLKGRTMAEEEEVKTRLSRFDLALPGGTMSCHAFFNILENFIRNSAKYSWSKRSKHNDLIFTVALKVDQKNHTIEFTIFDNKRDAYKKREKHKLIHSLKSRLSSLVILGENNTVDKENKGLKEMLFSAVWLKANEFDESLATIFTKIQMASNESKLELIKKYGFEFVSVNQNGLPCSDSRRANLGIRFTLPIFKRSEKLRNKNVRLTQLLRLHTDIIDVFSTKNSNKRLIFKRPYEHIFPRICYSGSTVLDVNQLTDMPVLDNTDTEVGIDVLRLRSAIIRNLGSIDEYLLTMNGTDEPVMNTNLSIDNLHIIRYDTHFSTKMTIEQLRNEFYGKYVYVDTISGNNFSKTLEGMFKSGIVEKNGRYLYASWNDMYLSLKIKEAALTHITIIDERLFNSVNWKVSSQGKVDIRKSAYELSMQNIRVLNFDDLNMCKQTAKKKNTISLPKNPLVQVSEIPLLCGNEFLPMGPSLSYPNGTHFLTIHLGLIEKILKSDRSNEICGEKGDNALSEERVGKFMAELKKIFTFPNRHLHICIHSGRGNYSSELAGPLKEYPFISLAALESSFNNSKYLLAQLFYNTVYIGKGEINKEN